MTSAAGRSFIGYLDHFMDADISFFQIDMPNVGAILLTLGECPGN